MNTSDFYVMRGITSMRKFRSAISLLTIAVIGMSLTTKATSAPSDLFIEDYGGTIYRATGAGAPTIYATLPNSCIGMVFDASDNLYASVYGSGAIYKVTPTGTVTEFASGMYGPEFLAIDKTGNLYCSSEYGGEVYKISSTGTVSNFLTGLYRPCGIAVDANGNVLVGEYFTDTLLTVSSTGTILNTLNTGNTEPGNLALSASGDLFLSDWVGAKVGVIHAGSKVVTPLASNIPLPDGIAVDAIGNVILAQYSYSGSGSVLQITPGGAVTTLYTGIGVPSEVAFEPAVETSTPEPGAIALLVGGGIAGGLAHRRRMRIKKQ